MRKHRYVRGLVAGFLLVGLVSCGDDDDATSTTGGVATTVTSPATTGSSTASSTADTADATAPTDTGSSGTESSPTTGGGGSAMATEPAADQLRIALSQLPAFLDPRLANPQSKIYLNLVFDYLVGLNGEGTELDPDTGVATGWETADSTTWTFAIRPGLTFSNGEPLTASDVVFSLNRIIEPSATSVYAPTLRNLIASIAASDDATVTIVLKKADFTFPYVLSGMQGTEGMIVPEEYLTEVGNDAFAAAPVGSGPYVLKDANPGVSLTFDWRGEQHPLYGAPRYGAITLTSVPAQSTRTAMLETGEVDLIDVDLATADPKALADEGFTVFEKDKANVVGINMHGQFVDGSPTANEKFREALALSIDKEAIQKSIYRGLGTLTGTFAPGSHGMGYQPMEPYPYDPEKAKQLLAESGYDGAPVDVYAFDIAGVPGLSRVTEVVAGYYTDIGVNAQIQTMDYASFRPLWFDKKIPGASSPLGSTNVQFPHASVYQSQFGCEGSISYACDPEFDKIVAEMVSHLDDESVYGSYLVKANAYLHDHYMSIPILEVGTYYAGDDVVPADWSLGFGQYDINIPDLIRQG